MQTAFDALYTAALQLPEDQRLQRASRLLETLPDEPSGLAIDDPNILEELNRRSADTKDALPWCQLRDEQ